MRQPEYADFRWNCETLYCVEEFWKQASEDDRADFARFVKEGKIGISANYLNFNDLVNADVFGKRLAKWQDKLQPFGTKIHTAMAADVNGFGTYNDDAALDSNRTVRDYTSKRFHSMHSKILSQGSGWAFP